MNKALRTIIMLLFCLLTTAGDAFASKNKSVDDAFFEETLTNLQKYIQINTENPPGNELKAVQFLKKILDKEKIESDVFDLGNGRANLVARLRAEKPQKGALALSHHTDVVPVEEKFWTEPPFSGLVKDGVLYGRGSVDIKGKGILDLMALVWLKRQNAKLKRDLIFIAVADEEVTSIGAKWLIDKKPNLLKEIAVLVDEGKTVAEDRLGKEGDYYVSIGEKAPLWLTLTFVGEPGHGSAPIENSAANQAVRAASKILEFSKMLSNEKISPELLALAKDSEGRKLIRNTISITGLKGSDKINTISNEASIQVDCRLLPGTDKDAFISRLKKAVGNKAMKIQVEEYYESLFSPADSEFIQALGRVAARAKVKVVPTILTSSTDGSRFRKAGPLVYGFEPYPMSQELIDTAHGNDERIKVQSLRRGLEILLELIEELN